MKLFDNVIIKATGQRGTIVDEETNSRGEHCFIVELKNIKEFDNSWEGLIDCRDEELEPA